MSALKYFVALLLSMFLLLCSALPLWAGSNDDSFILIPEPDSTDRRQDVEDLGNRAGSDGAPKESSFWDEYDEKANAYCWEEDIGSMIASGIMCWDIILLLLTQIVRFIANAALIVGAAMVIYAWYLYVTSVYAWDGSSKANNAIKYAAIGIVIVIFSYAIIRIAVSAFL